MNNVIQELLNIEKRALETVKDARELDENFEKAVDDSVEAIKKDIDEKVEQRIESISSFEKNEADKTIGKLTSEISAQKKQLSDKDFQNHDKWVEKIFNDIISI